MKIKARFEKAGLTRLVLTYNLKENTAQYQGKLKGKTVQVTDKNKSVTFTDVIAYFIIIWLKKKHY